MLPPSQERLKKSLIRAVTTEDSRVPVAGEMLCEIFLALHRVRTVTMAGPQPIAYAEIRAWACVSRTPIEPHHIAILRAMDDAWLAKERAALGVGQSSEARAQSTQEISPALFDAVFG